jgi:hypothetical protein
MTDMTREHARQNLTPRSAFSKRVRGNQIIRQRKARKAKLRFLPPEVDLKLIDRVLRWYSSGAKIYDIVQCAAKMPIVGTTNQAPIGVIDVYAILCYANSRGYAGIEQGDDPATGKPALKTIQQRRTDDEAEVSLDTYRRIVAGWRDGLKPRTIVDVLTPRVDGRRNHDSSKLRTHIDGICIALNRRVRQMELIAKQIAEQGELVAAANVAWQLRKLEHEHSSEHELFDLPELAEDVAAREKAEIAAEALMREWRETRGTKPPETPQVAAPPAPTGWNPKEAPQPVNPNNTDATSGDLAEILATTAEAFEEKIVARDLEKARPVTVAQRIANANDELAQATASSAQVQTDADMKRNVSSLFRKKPNN